jgi:hypothetical protein
MLMINPQLYQIDYDCLTRMARRARGQIEALILHWSAGRHDQIFDDYHLSLDGEGRLYASTSDLTEVLEHTWHRNQGSVGFALCCGLGAQAKQGFNTNFGPEPPTALQIDQSAQAAALLLRQLHLPLSPETVLTHCEAALEDGYGPYSGDPETRWDLWYLPDEPARQGLFPGGEVMRGKISWYLEQLGM